MIESSVIQLWECRSQEVSHSRWVWETRTLSVNQVKQKLLTILYGQSSYVKPPAPRDGIRKRGLWRWLGYKNGAAVVGLEPPETRRKIVCWLSVLAFQCVRIQATLLRQEGITYQEPSRLAPWPYRKASLESVRFLPYQAKFCFVLLCCAGDSPGFAHRGRSALHLSARQWPICLFVF